MVQTAWVCPADRAECARQFVADGWRMVRPPSPRLGLRNGKPDLAVYPNLSRMPRPTSGIL
ncbi:hypothetical protein ACFQZ4_25255 [Catellatospora coxensis]